MATYETREFEGFVLFAILSFMIFTIGFQESAL